MARPCVLVFAIAALGCGGNERDTPAAAPPPLTKPAPVAAPTAVTVAGVVIDQSSGKPVGDVEVVLRAEQDTTSTRAKTDGTFELRVPPGTYHAFVRDDDVMTTGLAERVRLDTAPRIELVDEPDEALMPVLEATSDITDLELTVAHGARLSGRVHDRAGSSVAGAVVRLRPANPFAAARPVLGTDSTITDEDGRYVVRVPAGSYTVEVGHDAFAGIGGVFDQLELDPGEKLEATLAVERGCIVSGRVVNADGTAAADGALERLGARGDGFGPAGRTDGGVFRWATTDDGSVTLRAWPWRSPPSAEKTFACKDGKRFTDVVLRIPDQRPDLSGVIVDAHDRPVPLAYVDISPLDPRASGQQERADTTGTWHVYDLSAGRYRVVAHAPGLGIVDTIVVAPRHDLRLKFGGTGRIVGTTTNLLDGSLEVSLLHCGPKDAPLQISHEPRIVRVVGGRFTIDRVPACVLSFAARWRDRVIDQVAAVEPDRAVYVTLDVGTPREKLITGVVRDAAGSPVEGARVTAVLHERESATARTDAAGRYTLQTHAGAQVVAGKGERVGRGLVGLANVASEHVDLVLDDAGY